MSRFARAIRPALEAELSRARQAEAHGDAALAFAHLERAHILGQPSTFEHVRVHGLMLAWAFRQHDGRELRGQVLRIVGAALLTVWGLVPEGNTGGSNISPLKRLSVPADLAALLARARQAP